MNSNTSRAGRTPEDIVQASTHPAPAGPGGPAAHPADDPWDSYHKQFAQLWWPHRYSRATGPVVYTDTDTDTDIDGTRYLFQTNALGCVRVRFDDVDALAGQLHMAANALVRSRNDITGLPPGTPTDPALAGYAKLVADLRGYLDRPDAAAHVRTHLLADLDQIITESEMDARAFGHEPSTAK